MVHFPSSFVYLNGKKHLSGCFTLDICWWISHKLPRLLLGTSPTLCWVWTLLKGTAWRGQLVRATCHRNMGKPSDVVSASTKAKSYHHYTCLFWRKKNRWSSQTKKWSFPRTPGLLDLVGIYANVSYEISKSCWGGKVSLYPRLSACSTILQFCSSTCNLP